jgi:hypothetical protein
VDDNGVFQPDYWGGGIYDFTYFVTDSFGCTGSDSYSLEVLEKDCFCTFFLPNAFSPNADGLNEEFGPKWECDLIDYRMEIWNRWGHLVFDTTDPMKNGTAPSMVEFRKKICTYSRFHTLEPI